MPDGRRGDRLAAGSAGGSSRSAREFGVRSSAEAHTCKGMHGHGHGREVDHHREQCPTSFAGRMGQHRVEELARRTVRAGIQSLAKARARCFGRGIGVPAASRAPADEVGPSAVLTEAQGIRSGGSARFSCIRGGIRRPPGGEVPARRWCCGHRPEGRAAGPSVLASVLDGPAYARDISRRKRGRAWRRLPP